MKKLLPFFFTMASAIAFAQTPCNDGFASSFPCDGFNLQSNISLQVMNASDGNDSWGWTDPTNGNEYALMGLDNGTAFVDITDPVNPIYLGKLPTHTSSSTWRDIKVFQDHAFVVSEAGGHGMQVFDLTRLRNVSNPSQTFTEDAHYSGFGSAHNIVINEDTGFAYAVGTSTFSGGGHYVDINNPTSPVAAGGFSQGGYTHDAQVIVYNGPDQDYVGQEIYIGSNADRIVIIDVTNKANPQTISTIFYNGEGYTHQGWLTEDRRFFLLGDELDEQFFGNKTRTLVFNFEDLDNPFLHLDFESDLNAIDHNGYVRGDLFFLSNYRAGLQVYDISELASGTITLDSSFDTYPSNDAAEFDGAWSVYPYFDSGNIVISDINRGLFVVKNPEILAVNKVEANLFSVTPNPAQDIIKVSSSENNSINSVEIYNVLGQRVISLQFSETELKNIDIASLNAGMYLVKINQNTVKRLIKK